jgi:hypothetical protein
MSQTITQYFRKESHLMRRILTTALLLTLPLVHACSGSKSEDSKVTQTRMDDIDNVEGTISDDMINTDESTETAPLDAAPVEPAKKPADKIVKKDEAVKPEAKSAPTDAVTE